MAEDRLYRPSNGSEGEYFFETWCARCKLDESRGGSCDRMMRSMAYSTSDIRYPQEWRCIIDRDRYETWCTAFVPLGSGGDDGERRAA